ncbi:transforming growth factor beta activator LRRC33-like [Pholidichthys leucotaenia]
MVRLMISRLLLLWSLSHDLSLTESADAASAEQSWNNQNLSSVPLDLDMSLRRLDLSRNFIRQLHTLALPYLEQLDLSSNELDFISEGTFESLPQLEGLNLARNRLDDNFFSNSKALQSLGRLKTLDISLNGLSEDAVELYLRNKSELAHLKLTGNALTRLSHNLFKETRDLRTITVDDNLISEIERGTFEPLIRLEALDMSGNNLVHMCDFKLHHVKYLNLSRNSLEFFVTREDDRFYKLEILDLRYNRLLYFPIVPKINCLTHLYLQNNMIGALNPEATMVSESNSLYNEIVGEKTMRKNSLHANWRGIPAVYIDLSFNHFRSFPIETLSLLSSLETLNFSYNCLHSIIWNIRNYTDSAHFRQLVFRSLKHLDLQNNGLVHMSSLFLNAITEIETLSLQGNSVQPCQSADHLRSSQSTPQVNRSTSCVEFGHLKTLKHLDLKDNNIKVLQPKTFKGTSLVSLNLSRNVHMVMNEGALEGVETTLQSLIISEINMTSSDLSLLCMPALTQLDISKNHLDEVPGSLSCSPLKEIDMRNNAFRTLNHSAIQALFVNLTVMYISGNPFNCCDSRWLMILNRMKIEVPDISETTCFTSVRNFIITEHLKTPLMYCALHTKAREVNFGQMIIIVLFVAVLSVVIIFSRKLCCIQRSFVV